MNRSIRLVPALLLAVAVVTVSVAGSASAAKLITGQQIKDGTVASVDVKNGSLTRGDLRPQSRTAVVVDLDDSTGIEVPACADTALATCPVLLSVPIVPGTQLVTASGVLDNTNATVPGISNRCGLVQGGEVLTEARFALAPNAQPGELSSFTLQQVVTVPDASLPVSLRCTELLPGEALRLNDPRLTSVRTGF
ncbi:hypothetical protein [Nocardioides sp.]|uniref:hypothetical protein n=1 Tax=Nocardioides sp. TaxID=35761 RepID=UPI00271998E6|nr:hypothetical protein [Nocardioides sp.]MDO9455679.1 hypothetical protein [Nocardioides sp.]